MDTQDNLNSEIQDIELTDQIVMLIRSEATRKAEIIDRNSFVEGLKSIGLSHIDISSKLESYVPNPDLLVIRFWIDELTTQYKTDIYYRRKTSAYFDSLKKDKAKEYTVDQYRSIYQSRLISEIDKEPHQQSAHAFERCLQHFTTKSGKGMLLLGPVGCGKTKMLKAFSVNPVASFSMVSCAQIMIDYKAKGADGIERYMKTQRPQVPQFYLGQKEIGWLFDDLGAEPRLSNYGDHMEVLGEIILHCYNFERLWPYLNITTNLNPDQIEERYSLRVRSRMREMFEVVQYDSTAIDLRC